jgi:hypothetical protein
MLRRGIGYRSISRSAGRIKPIKDRYVIHRAHLTPLKRGLPFVLFSFYKLYIAVYNFSRIFKPTSGVRLRT